jgi:hypothetical protein
MLSAGDRFHPFRHLPKRMASSEKASTWTLSRLRGCGGADEMVDGNKKIIDALTLMLYRDLLAAYTSIRQVQRRRQT